MKLASWELKPENQPEWLAPYTVRFIIYISELEKRVSDLRIKNKELQKKVAEFQHEQGRVARRASLLHPSTLNQARVVADLDAAKSERAKAISERDKAVVERDQFEHTIRDMQLQIERLKRQIAELKSMGAGQ